MPKQIYTEGNYVLLYDENGDAIEIPFEKDITHYIENKDTSFYISMRKNELLYRAIILFSELNAGDWEDETATAWTVANLRTFLRENTGFSAATGGSVVDGTTNGNIPIWNSSNSQYEPGEDKNIGDGDMTVATPGTRKLILGGDLSTDKYVIADNSENFDLYSIDATGDTSYRAGATGSTFHYWRDYNDNARVTMQLTTAESVLSLSSISGTNQLRCLTNSTQFAQNWYEGNLGLGFTASKPNGAENNVLFIKNGTAPAATDTDAIAFYSKDQAAGNACPHFMTELGDIIKLYKESALTAIDATATDGTIGTNDTLTNNIRTRLNELESRLQNIGII